SGAPLSGVQIRIYSQASALLTTATTTLQGTYLVRGLPAGKVFAVASGAGYQQQAYHAVPFTCVNGCPIPGNPIVVGDSQPGPIDFALRRGGQISGHGSDALTTAPLTAVSMQVFDASGQVVASATTDASGNYTAAPGLADGGYFVHTLNSAGYLDLAFDGI